MVAQRAVHIVQIHEVVRFEEVLGACVLLAERVLGVERVVAAMLSGQERGQVRAAGRNAVAAVEGDAVLQTPVEHARAEDRAITATHVDDGRFMCRRLCCLCQLCCLCRLCCLRHRQTPFAL